MFKRFEAIKRDAGFTLVELLVTVTIIGVLAAVVTVGVGGSASNAQVKANQANFGDVQSAVDAWLASNPTKTATDITVDAADQSAQSALWYKADGVALTTPATPPGASGAYGFIVFTQSTGSPAFNTFFRLNAASTVCILPKTAPGSVVASSSAVFACHN